MTKHKSQDFLDLFGENLLGGENSKIGSYSSMLGADLDYGKKAARVFIHLLIQNINASDIPKTAKSELITNINHMVIDAGNSIIGSVSIDEINRRSIVDPNQSVDLSVLYNNDFTYKKKYVEGDPSTYIMYYGKNKDGSKFKFPLNKPYGRGSNYFGDTIAEFKALYPDVEILVDDI